MPPAKTELSLAFTWTCDNCGRDNFTRGVTMPVEGIDSSLLPDDCTMTDVGFISPGVGGTFMLAPKSVTCQYCQRTYETVDAGSDD